MTSTVNLPKWTFQALLLLASALPLSAVAQYCTPSYTTACATSADFIQSFSTTGGSTNISNLNTGCSGNPNNYTFYSSQTVTAAAGNTFTWSIVNCPQYAEGYGIWIDFNQNGSFTDPGEQVASTTAAAGATITGTVTIPPTAAAGLTRMRIRCAYSTTQLAPCSTYSYGETEDYNLMVGTSPCTTAPAAGNINATPSVICASTPVSLVLTGYTAGTQIQWQLTSGTNWVNIPGATGSTLQLSTPTPTGFYRALVTCPGTTFSSTSAAFQVMLSPNPPCQDSVWPGDANYDHIVDNLDPLYIGLAYGYLGKARTGATIGWNAQFSTDWYASFSNGINYKNADCNGDSLVTTADLAAVTANYGLTHPRGSIANHAKVAGLPDLRADLTGVNLIPGTMATVPIRLGDAPGTTIQRIYGIAATLQLQGIILAAAPTMSFSPGLFDPLTSLNFYKGITNNQLDWAITRTNHQNNSGAGIVAYVSFMVPANASGDLTFHLQDVTVLDTAGQVMTDYNVVDQTATIHATGIAAPGSPATFAAIVPNPSEGSASLQLRLDRAADMEITVTDMAGRKAWQQALHAAAGASSVKLPGGDLAPGIYLVSVRMSADGAVQQLHWVKR